MTWPRGLRVDSEEAPSGWWGQVWPIGGLFLTVSAENPAVSLGFGTWELIANNAALLGWDPATGPLPGSVSPKVSSGTPAQAVPYLVIAIWQRTA